MPFRHRTKISENKPSRLIILSTMQERGTNSAAKQQSFFCGNSSRVQYVLMLQTDSHAHLLRGRKLYIQEKGARWLKFTRLRVTAYIYNISALPCKNPYFKLLESTTHSFTHSLNRHSFTKHETIANRYFSRRFCGLWIGQCGRRRFATTRSQQRRFFAERTAQ